MSNRSWFYASNGQQQGPIPKPSFATSSPRGRSGRTRWSGPRAWRLAEGRRNSRPDVRRRRARRPCRSRRSAADGERRRYAMRHGGGSLSVDFGIWEFTLAQPRALIGFLLVIPAPWVLVWYLPMDRLLRAGAGRPNLGFTGQAMTSGAGSSCCIVLAIYVGLIGIALLSNLLLLVQIVLYWLLLKWIVANLASNGQPLGLSFSGCASGLYRLASAARASPSSPSSAGPGSTRR